MAEAQPVQSGMVRFVLVGKREGFSGYLGGGGTSRHKFPFSKGVCNLPFQEAELARKRMAFHAAYPEGSNELAEAQRKWRESQGETDGSTETPPSGSGVRPDGEGSGERSADDRSGADETQAGETGVVPEGDRPERTENAMSIAEAVALLSHVKDDHWTQDGKPSIKLIQQLCKNQSIKRSEIDEVGVVRKQ